MDNCQVIGFVCPVESLCTRCKGSGNEPREELCQHCDHCFDEEVGWSTGIEPGTEAQSMAHEWIISGLRYGA